MPVTVLPHAAYAGKRFVPSTNVEGTITPGLKSAFTTSGTMSAVSPSDVALLPEGKRTRQAFNYITADALQVAGQSGLQPDWIYNSGFWFEVSAMKPWQNQVISHFEYVITKIENPQDYVS